MTKGDMIKALKEIGVTRHRDGKKLTTHKTTEVRKLYIKHCMK